MSDYTPLTEEREALAKALFLADTDPTHAEAGERLWASIQRRAPGMSEWHRQGDLLFSSGWLAQHDAEVRKQVAEEIATAMHPMLRSMISRGEAARIAREIGGAS